MLTIIFGAGASYDSFPDYPAVGEITNTHVQKYRPPLAKHLFEDRFGPEAEENPIVAGALFPQLREAAKKDPPDVEGKLEEISKSMSTYSKTYRQLLSMRYYLRDVIEKSETDWIKGVTHNVLTYGRFLDILDRWRETVGQNKISLITFNYDRFLDESCISTLDLRLVDINSYVMNTTAYQLFKPHGSLGWCREVEGLPEDIIERINSIPDVPSPDLREIILENTEKITVTNSYFINTQNRLLPYGTPFIPAIAIPTLTKTEFEFPEEHLTQLKYVMRNTTSLIIIGWRAAEQHFLRLWKDNTDPTKLKTILIVNTDPKNSNSIYENLTNYAGVTCRNIQYSYKGFSFFVARDFATFLNQVA
jgi:hypothetical protein